MNYLYQTSGLMARDDKEKYNFSDYKLPALDEYHLDETKGIDPNHVTQGKFYGMSFKLPESLNLFDHIIRFFNKKHKSEIEIKEAYDISKIDWNRDGKIEKDVHFDIAPANDGHIRESINDWERLVFKGGLIGGFGVTFADLEKEMADGATKEELEELSADDLVALGLVGNPGDITVTPLTRVLKAGADNQLSLKIVNLYPQDTTFKLTLTSNQWLEPLVYDLEAKGRVGELAETIIELPLSIPLREGELHLTYYIQKQYAGELEFTQNLVVEERSIISVLKPTSKENPSRDYKDDQDISSEPDASLLSDSQKSSLAEKIAFSETRSDLDKVRAEFDYLVALTAEIKTEKRVPIEPALSVAPVAKGEVLPKTGDKSRLATVIAGFGLLLTSLGLAYHRKRS